MSAWLKKPEPMPAPADPGHVDYDALVTALEASRSVGVDTPAMAYLEIVRPMMETDQWGAFVPLSEYDQFNVDRVVAILRAPYERGTALLRAGMLAPDEVSAIELVYPDVYAVMVVEATRDMVNHPPPYPDWSEEVLGVLFQKPASEVYTSAKGTEMKAQGSVEASAPPTVAERREVAVREAR